MEWRPISTAPKDGTRVLLLSKAYTVPADEWHPADDHQAEVFTAAWDSANEDWAACEGGWFEPDEVSHWMPLPAPPSETDQ